MSGTAATPGAATSAASESSGVSATWTVQSLGVLHGGTYSEAYGIGDNGWVVGTGDWMDPVPGSSCSTPNAAFVYRGGQLVNLHLSMPDCQTYTHSTAFDVNASGTVVGSASAAGDAVAALWDASGNYQTIAGGCQNAVALGINNAGTVVGWFEDCNGGGFHPFVWTPSSGVVDAIPPGYSFGLAVDITDSGVIIGELDSQTAAWTLGGPVTIIPGATTTVGRGFEQTYAVGGASAGSAVGFVGGDGAQSWKYLGAFAPLPPFTPGAATDASAKRRVVGWRTQPDLRAVTVSPSSGVTLLPGLTSSNAAYATAVNRCGSIAGYAPNAEGLNRAVVWRIGTCDP